MKDMGYSIVSDFNFEACPVPTFGDVPSKTHYEINITHGDDGGFAELSKEEVQELIVAMTNWLAYTEE